MDYSSYLDESNGYANEVSSRIDHAKSLVQQANAVASGKMQTKGMIMSGVSGGLLIASKMANKAFGLNKNLNTGLDNIKQRFQTNESTPETEYSTSYENPAFDKTSSNSAPAPEEEEGVETSASDIPEGAGGGEDVSNLGSSGGMSAEDASNFTSGTVADAGDGGDAAASTVADGGDAVADAGDAAATSAVEGGTSAVEAFAGTAEGLEIAGGVLDATGIGSVVGTVLEVAAVVGTAIAGLVDMFDSHKEAQAPQPPDISMFAQPVFQAGFTS
jgi:hypothetical protein